MHIKVEIGKHEFNSMIDKLKVKDESRLIKQSLMDVIKRRLELRAHDSVEIIIIEV